MLTRIGSLPIPAPEKKAKKRPYYHADIGAAANHIQAHGEAIIWNKEKKHKLFAPIKVNVMHILDHHGGVLGSKGPYPDHARTLSAAPNPSEFHP